MLLLVSCEKERLVLMENTDIPLISKVLVNGETFKLFTYNESNLVTEEKTKYHYTRHSYNDNNELTSSEFYFDMSMASSDSRVIEAAMNRKEWVSPENTEKSLTKTFAYLDQKTRVNFNRNSQGQPEYSEFIFENGRAVRQIMYWGGPVSGYINYFYDDRGNVVREDRYLVPDGGGAILNTTTEYEYDHMMNPFRAFRKLITPGIYTNINNIVRETYIIYFDVPPGTGQTHITEYSYDYDLQGYPVTVNGDTEYIYR